MRGLVYLATRTKLGPWVCAIAIIGFAATHANRQGDDFRKAEAERIANETPAQREAELDAEDAPAARLECRQAVKHRLHDPDSAELDDYTRYAATKIGSGDYNVFVTGRAKNGFGAMRRIAVICETQRFGSSWSIASVGEIL